mmetsp:Transcript_16954/g.36643  ORF Transcript_16954/g.36643 Transcript_16954/m.36643 type:complete len:91 (-) Transcript_16954:140-412(-)
MVSKPNTSQALRKCCSAISNRYARKKLTLAALSFVHLDQLIITADLSDTDSVEAARTTVGKSILSNPKKTAFPSNPAAPKRIAEFVSHAA